MYKRFSRSQKKRQNRVRRVGAGFGDTFFVRYRTPIKDFRYGTIYILYTFFLTCIFHSIYSATQYLKDNGYYAFFHWFDHRSWYPLGRPVGTTIYPGMQIVAVTLWNALRWKQWSVLLGFPIKMSLNDVCVFMPAWFGSIASVCVGFLTREASGSLFAGGVAALIMAVIPAHIMRSVGGGYDNESVAVTAMCLTFLLWTRSLRSSSSWLFGALAGLAYAFMAASWGGYIFVGNMVALHAAGLVVRGYFSPSLHISYTLWYIIGTSIATFVPVIGWAPYRSLEQAAPLLVFFGMHLKAILDYIAEKHYKITWGGDWKRKLRHDVVTYGIIGTVCLVILVLGILTGTFGDLSIRVRSLFFKHTRTGNPLVDSVAEHQPASTEAYKQYLHHAYALAPVGLAILGFDAIASAKSISQKGFGVNANKWFLILYAVVGYYFSAKMSRLIILLGPVASALGGIAIAGILEWCVNQFSAGVTALNGVFNNNAPETTTVIPSNSFTTFPLSLFKPTFDKIRTAYNTNYGKIVRLALAMYLLYMGPSSATSFYAYSNDFAQRISQPSIMFQARLQDGREVMVNDYQEAYWWLRDNTPEDSRVLSWWDYGYQIAGIANRTTLADGNTWSLEHIALLGRILTAPEKHAHELARHLADYVLVWAGNAGDDLAKSPHMARIGSSVFPDVCPRDPLCRNFGFYPNHQPTPSMERSLLYKLHSSGLKPGINVDPSLFQHVYSSKYGLVRIYKVMDVDQESREWLADPSNRICDAPGSWYCVGQYPPKLPITIPKSHRHVDYDNPDKYVEEINGDSKGHATTGSSAGSSTTDGTKKKKKKATPTPDAEL